MVCNTFEKNIMFIHLYRRLFFINPKALEKTWNVIENPKDMKLSYEIGIWHFFNMQFYKMVKKVFLVSISFSFILLFSQKELKHPIKRGEKKNKKNTLALTTGFWGKEAWHPTPKWNTRFFFAFSKWTQLWLPMVWRKWENSFGKAGKKEFKGKGI